MCIRWRRAVSGAKGSSDNDPIVLAHAALGSRGYQTVVFKSDIRQPAQILSDQRPAA